MHVLQQEQMKHLSKTNKKHSAENVELKYICLHCHKKVQSIYEQHVHICSKSFSQGAKQIFDNF